jgi:ABC-type nitrate/sulfonate/bicarbonate transport system substrate-binding protein
VAYGQQLERSSLKLGVANKAHLYYLPLTVAERRGHFKDYGLTIATGDFEGGGQSLEALLAGSVDVVTGAYEHTLHTQAKGQDIRAVIELGRFPGIVLAVGKDRPFKSHADLQGMKIGVTVPGSSSHFFVLYLMAKAGHPGQQAHHRMWPRIRCPVEGLGLQKLPTSQQHAALLAGQRLHMHRSVQAQQGQQPRQQGQWGRESASLALARDRLRGWACEMGYRGWSLRLACR